MKKSNSHSFANFTILFITLSFAPLISARFFLPDIPSIPRDLLRNATVSAWESFHNFSGCQPGQKYTGLDKLKTYFNNFGYLPNSSDIYTDDFDDAFESAVKTYQRNFNLNVTGQLDDQTIQQIQRPRCGNADVINGSTTMNSGKPSSGHIHTTAHYAFFPGQPRWRKTELTYAFNPGNALTEEVKSVFARAFDRWSAVIPLTFTRTEGYSGADLKIGFFSGDHGDGEAFDGVLGTLAHAFSPTAGVLHMDMDESWIVSGDIRNYALTTAVDLESVAVHEIGHLLGLGHSSIESAIMYPTITSGTRRVELASDDIEGVQFLYGSNPNYNGSTAAASSPPVHQRDSSGAYGVHSRSWGLSSLMALGFLAVILGVNY